MQKVGIVGAGLMATQLATLFVRRLEVPVVMRDLEQSRVDDALETIREEVGERKPFLATLVDGGTGWEQFAGCDLVLEAVFEELDVKREVFAAVREVAPDAILMTNTSSLSVEEMGADVGMHFFNPVAVMPLVEIVRARRGRPTSCSRRRGTSSKKLRKRGVLVGDAPGFVVNRVLTRMTRALMDALENGNTVEEVDEAMLGARHADGAVGADRRWSARASRSTCSRRCTPRIPTASRSRRRSRRSRTARSRSRSRTTRRTVEEIRRPCSRRSRTRSGTCSTRASSAIRRTSTRA